MAEGKQAAATALLLPGHGSVLGRSSQADGACEHAGLAGGT